MNLSTAVTVKRVAARWRTAQERADKLRQELDDELRAARENGEQPKALIEASGLSRQTVFDAFKANDHAPALTTTKD